MLPDPALLVAAHDGRLRPDGRPGPEWREELRRIPNARNALSVGAAWAQVVVIAWAAVRFDHPIVWVLAIVLMDHALRQRAQNADVVHTTPVIPGQSK